MALTDWEAKRRRWMVLQDLDIQTKIEPEKTVPPERIADAVALNVEQVRVTCEELVKRGCMSPIRSQVRVKIGPIHGLRQQPSHWPQIIAVSMTDVGRQAVANCTVPGDEWPE